jgi:hypothetical protein
MKKLFYKYLNAFYVLGKNGRGNYVIFKKENDVIKYDDEKLIKELVEIFGYSYTRSKWAINSWAKTIIPHVDLSNYWSSRHSIDFPIARSISSSLIGGDLISIEPMSAPTGNLFYLDYQYGQIDHPTPDYQIGVPKPRNPDRNEIIRKWQASGLLDFYDGSKQSLAALYESQARQFLE